jgi:hypothetical protein
MKHFVIIHQKHGLPDLKDEYSSADEARKAIEQIGARAVGIPIGSIVTPSKNVVFNIADFAGAEYKPDGTDEMGAG